MITEVKIILRLYPLSFILSFIIHEYLAWLDHPLPIRFLLG
jgi:hypothetical protein